MLMVAVRGRVCVPEAGEWPVWKDPGHLEEVVLVRLSPAPRPPFGCTC